MRTFTLRGLLLMGLATGCDGGSATAPAPADGGSGGAIPPRAGTDAAWANGSGSGGGGGGAPGIGDAGADVPAVSDGGTDDVNVTACEKVVATVDRHCAAAADCVAVQHQTDFMGQIRLLGIRSSEMMHFTDLEKGCQPTKKTFDLPATTADDGSLVDNTANSTNAVTCQASVCRTFSPACKQLCTDNHICITCGSGGAAVSVCSQDCTMNACSEMPRTSCLGGASVNGGPGQFCFDPKFSAGFMSSSCHR